MRDKTLKCEKLKGREFQNMIIQFAQPRLPKLPWRIDKTILMENLGAFRNYMTVLTHNCYFYIVHEVWYELEIPMISLKEVYLLVSKSLPPTLPSHLSVFHPPFLSLLFLEDPSLRISTHLVATPLFHD